MKTSLQPSHDALKNLEQALAITSPSELERDGSIQRFEYCYEILWKAAQRILKENEVQAETPKNVFRELGRLGWIDNVEDWFAFQKDRNETSHEYGLKFALHSYSLAKKFLPLAQELYRILKEKGRD